ncbi:MAG: hypothetical protein R3F62_21710 [Planctomycetota bacterium]
MSLVVDTPTPELTTPRWRTPAPQLPEATPAQATTLLAETAAVIGVDPVRVVVSSGATLELRWALPFQGELAVGDAVQVLVQGERCYGVGVLRSAGRFRLLLSEAAQLRGLRVRLRGDRGVKLLAPDLKLKARHLVVDATEVAESLGGAVRRVLGVLKVRAKQARTIVAGEHHLRAKRRRAVGAEAHRLDGTLVQFGQ